ncbi:hypothetical protein SDJN02_06413, partial [Cucurbita argyrosperma subsp. argyrosperma]
LDLQIGVGIIFRFESGDSDWRLHLKNPLGFTFRFLAWPYFKMGKNQAYKAMQKARLGSSSSAGPVEIEDGMVCTLPHYYPCLVTFLETVIIEKSLSLNGSLNVDGSFHSPEWHAARLASLNTSHTITWEEYKKKQKEDELKKGELEADTDRMMKEYRAQLDAERARKLAQGRNCSSSKSGHEKERKNRDLKKRSKKRRKHSRRKSSESSSSCSPSDSSSSDEEERESRRSRSRSKRSKREKKHKSRTKHSSSDDEEADGPVPLSRFFEKVKN